MNTNPFVKRILVFGDSIAWGRIPGDDNTKRFPPNIRWTGILQDILGSEYEVIEEALCGRTTDVDSPDKAGKNGATYLFSCIESQNPVDLVILVLGKNDMKFKYNRTPEQISLGLKNCIDIIEREGKNHAGQKPKLMIISPAIIKELERVRFGKKEIDFKDASNKSRALAPLYKTLANDYQAAYLNLSEFVEVSDIDGVHLDECAQRVVGEKVGELMKNNMSL